MKFYEVRTRLCFFADWMPTAKRRKTYCSQPKLILSNFLNTSEQSKLPSSSVQDMTDWALSSDEITEDASSATGCDSPVETEIEK